MPGLGALTAERGASTEAPASHEGFHEGLAANNGDLVNRAFSMQNALEQVAIEQKAQPQQGGSDTGPRSRQEQMRRAVRQARTGPPSRQEQVREAVRQARTGPPSRQEQVRAAVRDASARSASSPGTTNQERSSLAAEQLVQKDSGQFAQASAYPLETGQSTYQPEVNQSAQATEQRVEVAQEHGATEPHVEQVDPAVSQVRQTAAEHRSVQSIDETTRAITGGRPGEGPDNGQGDFARREAEIAEAKAQQASASEGSESSSATSPRVEATAFTSTSLQTATEQAVVEPAEIPTFSLLQNAVEQGLVKSTEISIFASPQTAVEQGLLEPTEVSSTPERSGDDPRDFPRWEAEIAEMRARPRAQALEMGEPLIATEPHAEATALTTPSQQSAVEQGLIESRELSSDHTERVSNDHSQENSRFDIDSTTDANTKNSELHLASQASTEAVEQQLLSTERVNDQRQENPLWDVERDLHQDEQKLSYEISYSNEGDDSRLANDASTLSPNLDNRSNPTPTDERPPRMNDLIMQAATRDNPELNGIIQNYATPYSPNAPQVLFDIAFRKIIEENFPDHEKSSSPPPPPPPPHDGGGGGGGGGDHNDDDDNNRDNNNGKNQFTYIWDGGWNPDTGQFQYYKVTIDPEGKITVTYHTPSEVPPEVRQHYQHLEERTPPGGALDGLGTGHDGRIGNAPRESTVEKPFTSWDEVDPRIFSRVVLQWRRGAVQVNQVLAEGAQRRRWFSNEIKRLNGIKGNKGRLARAALYREQAAWEREYSQKLGTVIRDQYHLVAETYELFAAMRNVDPTKLDDVIIELLANLKDEAVRGPFGPTSIGVAKFLEDSFPEGLPGGIEGAYVRGQALRAYAQIFEAAYPPGSERRHNTDTAKALRIEGDKILREMMKTGGEEAGRQEREAASQEAMALNQQAKFRILFATALAGVAGQPGLMIGAGARVVSDAAGPAR